MPNKITYRGFEIEHTNLGWQVSKNDKNRYLADSEDAAYHWIDGEKAVEHKTEQR